MRAVQPMGTYASGGTAASRALTTRDPLRWDLELAAVYLKSATVQCTGVTHGSGTFTRLARVVGATTALELWAGRGFAKGDVDGTTDFTFGASVGYGVYSSFFQTGVAQAAPTVSLTAGATAGTGVVNGGAITPTAADESQVVVMLEGHASQTAPTWTHTPGGNESYYVGGGTGTTVPTGRLHMNHRVASSLSAHNITAADLAVEWVALQALVTPTPSPVRADTTHVYKGRRLRSLDTVGAS